MGLYKLCEHKGRARDRCEHAWWACFRHARVSLEKWSNREVRTKTDADIAFDDCGVRSARVRSTNEASIHRETSARKRSANSPRSTRSGTSSPRGSR